MNIVTSLKNYLNILSDKFLTIFHHCSDHIEDFCRKSEKLYEDEKLNKLRNEAKRAEEKAEKQKKANKEREEYRKKTEEYRQYAEDAKKKQQESKMQSDLENEVFEKQELRNSLTKSLTFFINSLDVLVDSFFIFGMEFVLLITSNIFTSKTIHSLIINHEIIFLLAFLFVFLTEKSLVLSILSKDKKLSSFLIVIITILLSIIAILLIPFITPNMLNNTYKIYLIITVIAALLSLLVFQILVQSRDKTIVRKIISGSILIALANICIFYLKITKKI